ncbi:ATP-binding protein [Streptomyces sp. NPDC014892]|uniref:ATP-binding protein n=1 Tax=Streptomyces sp. NPDC014892 TaxID=3364930 RepID=UPI0036F5284B
MTAAHHALTAQAPDAAIDTPCRMLRLPTMRAQAADTIARAEREGLSYAGSLAELPRAECEDRDRRQAERRIRAAHFPREQSLLGNSGRGKSHLLIGLGTAAAMAGYRVRYTTAASLVNRRGVVGADGSCSLRYAACTRYAPGGGLAAERRAFRAKLRLEAAEWFQSGDENVIIAQVVGEAWLE